ncbi:phosphate signaling complex protein PhoU [Paenibacillus sp. GP183]|uniref:phosphate signaling complex protein PhoU n=1 Tax=Paenibacillus sp. GP183 TaxID=1882751 RepID=UPI000897A3D2|nr:phosphate signaling complex protein PhoU [Paenibacillus sp. GP183]SEC42142.1 phosphate uptake regulator, PhoU [Paenibacillus sp. GP183]
MEARSSFHHSLDELQRKLLDMGASVKHMIHSAGESLARHDDKLANDVIDSDDKIDESLQHIEELCLQLIALQQPMASDLRIIGTALKISTDLERIADHAVDIAKITIRLSGEELVKPLEDIPRMVNLAKEMLLESLLSYTERNVHRAAALSEKEEQVDTLYSSIMSEMVELMSSETAKKNRQLTHLILVAHHLERVADHITNIGEGVIYMVTGTRKVLNI